MRGGDSIPKHAFELIMDVENEKDRHEDIKPLMEMLNITPTFVVNKDNVFGFKFSIFSGEIRVSLHINLQEGYSSFHLFTIIVPIHPFEP